jgi:hypothetical protein
MAYASPMSVGLPVAREHVQRAAERNAFLFPPPLLLRDANERKAPES